MSLLLVDSRRFHSTCICDLFQMKEPIFIKKTCSEIAHLWNRMVDKTLGPVIESLSSRGW